MDLLAAAERWAERTPGRTAFEGNGERLTFGELERRRRAVTGALAARFPDDGAPIIVRGHKEPELLIGFLGCLGAGHPYIPVDSAVPDARVEQIAELAGALGVFGPADLRALADEGRSAAPRARPPHEVQYIMFTSGSTGEPKGVPITRANLAQFLGWMVAEQGFAPSAERFLNQVVYSFDLSVMDTGLALVTGGTSVALTRDTIADPRRLFQVLADSDLTVWVSTPTFVQLCLVEPKFSAAMLPRLRRFLFCGETLPPETAAARLDRFPEAQVWNTYGPTEAAVATTSVRVDHAILRRYPSLPVGRAAPGTRVLVVDDAFQPVPDGERGEIVIVGPNVSPGYLHRPELTRDVFRLLDGDRAYRTGDWGHYEDGWLFFDGRRDGQIKLHGHRIELGDVETHLAALPGVLAAVVVPVYRNGQPNSLVGFVVAGNNVEEPEVSFGKALKRGLRRSVPEYMVPRRIRRLDAFPMTPNGKVDRHRLTELVS